MDDLRPEEDTLEPVETWPLPRLRALQAERLRWTLRHACERLPHHRQAFDDAGLHPDDIETLDDLPRLPFTTRKDLRGDDPFDLFAVPRERIARIHVASGATGAPIVAAHTQRDLAIRAALMARSIRAAGVRPGWAIHIAHRYGLAADGLAAHDGAEKHGCAVIPVSDAPAATQVRLIHDLRPEAIMATPGHMLALRDAFRAAGLDPRRSSLKLAILGAGPWTEAMRTEIEAAFDMHALAIYGPPEIGLGIAQECIETKDGPTFWEDHCYPEIVDPRTGRVLPEGEPGELVLTTLTREAMPLIRYRTGDLARLLPGTARTMRRLHRIEDQAI